MPGFREQQPARDVILPYDVETCAARLQEALLSRWSVFGIGVIGRLDRRNHLVAEQKKGITKRFPAAVLIVDLSVEGSGTRLRYGFVHDWRRYALVAFCAVWVCAFTIASLAGYGCDGPECPPPLWFFAAWGCLPAVIMLTVQHFTAPKERAYLTAWLEETCGTSLPRDATP